uniref:Uncharacterized protein n=1 Tax=Rhizophora mucronata TaxID=61149 RepID=A0A2P2NLX2_RHIMU
MPSAKVGAKPRSDVKKKETTKFDTEANAKVGETSNLNAKQNMKAATTSISDPRVGDEMAVKSSAISVSKEGSNITESLTSNPTAGDSVPSNGVKAKSSLKTSNPKV